MLNGFLILVAVTLLTGCFDSGPKDEVVVEAVSRELFEAPLEKNEYLKDFYHIVSVEKVSHEILDLTNASRGALKAQGQVVHTKVVLQLKKDCRSRTNHARYPIPSCDLEWAPQANIETTTVAPRRKGETFKLDRVDLKFIKNADAPNGGWTIF